LIQWFEVNPTFLTTLVWLGFPQASLITVLDPLSSSQWYWFCGRTLLG